MIKGTKDEESHKAFYGPDPKETHSRVTHSPLARTGTMVAHWHLKVLLPGTRGESDIGDP
jgi:hypothetical protein